MKICDQQNMYLCWKKWGQMSSLEEEMFGGRESETNVPDNRRKALRRP